ncbi:MAG: MarR family winged helix-turn-helix transcriptional regulator [Rhizobiaceae bacterium]
MTVKKNKPEIIEHIGWDLWRVSLLWKQKFSEEMIVRGHGWFGEARGNLIQHIGPNGIAQSHLDAKVVMTKQAVQQHLDDLVKDGVVERIQDPNDARKKLVRLTTFGCEAHEDGNQIKQEIEKDFTRLIGKQAMKSLKQSLATIIENEN